MAKVIVVDGVEFAVGKASAAQVAAILKVIKSMGTSAREVVGGFGEGADNLSLVFGIIGALDEENLITLASASLGCSREFAEEHFDLEWVSDALVTAIEASNLGAVVRNFSRLSSLITE